jgi:hypothetical protein
MSSNFYAGQFLCWSCELWIGPEDSPSLPSQLCEPCKAAQGGDTASREEDDGGESCKADGFGAVCVCALCEQPIEQPAENAVIFQSAGGGTKYLCPTCVQRVQLMAPRERKGSPAGDAMESTAGGRNGTPTATVSPESLPPPPRLVIDRWGALYVVPPGSERRVSLTTWLAGRLADEARAQRGRTPENRAFSAAAGDATNGGLCPCGGLLATVGVLMDVGWDGYYRCQSCRRRFERTEVSHAG